MKDVKISTRETLQKSLLALSQSDTVHYEVTAAEIAATRYALLKLDGISIDAEMAAEHADIAKRKRALEKELAALVEKKNRIKEQIDELEEKKAELEIEEQPIESEIAETEQ